MDNCRHCNAKLTPGIEWCPQCYTRTGPPLPGLPQAAPPGAPAQTSAISSPLIPREMSPDMLIQNFSRMKAGETSFGWMGRTMLSFGVLVLGVIGYFVAAGNLGFEPGWSSFEMYLPVFFIGGGALLWIVWRPSRVDSRHR